MISGKRKTIGVFINKTDVFFGDTAYRTIRRCAERLNYDVVAFSTMGQHRSNNDYDAQEMRMFDFAPVEELDGIIAAPDTYEMLGFRDALIRMLTERAHCPVASIRCHSGVGDCFFTDDSVAIRPLIRHLIETHGAKRIAFMAGFDGHQDSDARLRCYREELAAYGLEVPENGIFYGTLWVTDGPDAFRHFFGGNAPRPDAVVCANDYMARGLIDEMKRHGIRVPEDVLVTGFDHLIGYRTGFLTLTTVEQDYEAITTRAMEQLDRRIRGLESGPAPRQFAYPGKVILGESCGCCRPEYETVARTAMDSAAQYARLDTMTSELTYMDVDMSACDSLEEMHSVFMRRRSALPTWRDFYLCLFEKPTETGTEHRFAEKMSDHACLIMGMRDREDLGMPMITFDRRLLLPPSMERPDRPQMLYLVLLHQKDSFYGYAVTRYMGEETPSPFYQMLNMMFAGVVRNMHIRNQLRALYEERRVSSITDVLTRLFNRRGLEEQLEPLWRKLTRDGASIALVYFDIDQLKQINDTFGHSAGDFAIRMVSAAIRKSAVRDGISARMGGDEFLTVLPEADQKDADLYMARFSECLHHLNDAEKRTFRVECSCGAYVVRLNENVTLEECIQGSDKVMYGIKSRRHAGRNA